MRGEPHHLDEGGVILSLPHHLHGHGAVEGVGELLDRRALAEAQHVRDQAIHRLEVAAHRAPRGLEGIEDDLRVVDQVLLGVTPGCFQERPDLGHPAELADRDDVERQR